MVLTLTQNHSHALNHIQGMFNPFMLTYVRTKDNRSIKAFRNLLDFVHQLPCDINLLFQPLLSHDIAQNDINSVLSTVSVIASFNEPFSTSHF